MINLTKSFKLKSLFINDVVQVEAFQLLLQKFGDYMNIISLFIQH